MADLESFIWYMVWSSQKSFPHLRQFTDPFALPSRFSHRVSAHTSAYPGRCQCDLVTSSSGSLGLASGTGCSAVATPLAGLAGVCAGDDAPGDEGIDSAPD